MASGYSSVGLLRPKDPSNLGGIMRAAYCFGVSMIAVQGDRTTIRSQTDTPKAYRHIPVVRTNDLRDLIPYDAVPVAVDLVDGAETLVSFQHPIRAFYVFGPEDGTIPDSVLEWCQHRVMIPTRMCINLAASANVVLYDRMAKADRCARGIRYSDLSERAKAKEAVE